MKKFFAMGFSLGLMLFGASCSDQVDEPTPSPKGENAGLNTVTITAEIPQGLRSRGADSDGWFANKNPEVLRYSIYEDEAFVKSGEETLVDGRCALNLSLEKDPENYKIVMYACNRCSENTFFYVSDNPCQLEFSWHDSWRNDKPVENTLYQYENSEIFYYTGKIKPSVTLKRPYVQLCVVTDEGILSGANLKDYEVGVTWVTQAYGAKMPTLYDLLPSIDGYFNENNQLVDMSNYRVSQYTNGTSLNIAECPNAQYIFVGNIPPCMMNGETYGSATLQLTFAKKGDPVTQANPVVKRINLPFNATMMNERIVVYPKNTSENGGFLSSAAQIGVVVETDFQGQKNYYIE